MHGGGDSNCRRRIAFGDNNPFEVGFTSFGKLSNLKLNPKSLASEVHRQGANHKRYEELTRKNNAKASGASMENQVEHVARAFYDVQNEAATWEHASEETKELFRVDARTAIALMHDAQEQRLLASLQPLTTILPAYEMASGAAAKISDAA
jgi:hypothetical protein